MSEFWRADPRVSGKNCIECKCTGSSAWFGAWATTTPVFAVKKKRPPPLLRPLKTRSVCVRERGRVSCLFKTAVRLLA